MNIFIQQGLTIFSKLFNTEIIEPEIITEIKGLETLVDLHKLDLSNNQIFEISNLNNIY